MISILPLHSFAVLSHSSRESYSLNIAFLLQLDQGQELEDMVKYLELEQQFSTKKTKICEHKYD